MKHEDIRQEIRGQHCFGCSELLDWAEIIITAVKPYAGHQNYMLPDWVAIGCHECQLVTAFWKIRQRKNLDKTFFIKNCPDRRRRLLQHNEL